MFEYCGLTVIDPSDTNKIKEYFGDQIKPVHYLIPNVEIYSAPMNKKETFRDQQLQKRRPRFSLRKLIKSLDIEPIGVYNLYDL